jgi:hypothetical protein
MFEGQICSLRGAFTIRLSRPTQASTAVRSAVRCDRHPERFMFLAPLCIVLLMGVMRAGPPRCNIVLRGLAAMPGKPRQGRLPSSHLPGRGSVTSRLLFVGRLMTENDLRGTNPCRTGQFTVMLNCWEACTPVLSVTVSVNVYVPFAVGVPLMVVPPFDPVVTARPGGSCPAVIDQV